ncbi:hypothetical protein J6590_006867 [Homalodisca vitripennis]|nr:hypothetical protein J6590_006867 [Homalodisca vitripennis]
MKEVMLCFDITTTSKSRLNCAYIAKKWRKFFVQLNIASLNGRKSSCDRCRNQCRTVGYKNWRTVSAIKISIIIIAETSLSCVNRLRLDSRNNQRYNCSPTVLVSKIPVLCWYLFVIFVFPKRIHVFSKDHRKEKLLGIHNVMSTHRKTQR